MKLVEINTECLRSRDYLGESWNGLSSKQQKYLSRFENELWPLMESYDRAILEASLTADQVQQIFTDIETSMTQGGKNRTLIGKGVDVAKIPVDIMKKIDAKITELGKMAQDSGPVKNMDAKFEELKKKIGEKDSKIVQGIKFVSDWAKENPGKASLAVGILTAAAAFAGGPAGGAAAGFLLRASKDLLQGEKLSSAVGKSLKTAAYGAIAGWALNGIGDWLEGLRVNAIPYDRAPGLTTLDVGFTKTFEVPGFSSVKELGSMIVPEDRVAEFTNLLNGIKEATAATGSTTDPAALDAFNELWNFTKSFDTKAFIADMNLQNEVAKAIAVANDSFLQNLTIANDAIAAAAQGSVQAGGKQTPIKVGGKEVEPVQGELDLQPRQESSLPKGKKLSEGQVYMVFNRLESHYVLLEADPKQMKLPLNNPNSLAAKAGRGLKGLAGKAAGAIKQGAKNLTTKVTADKLNKAWKDAGSPTDSNELAKFLQSQGVDDESLNSVYQAMKLPVPASAEPQASTADAGTDKSTAQGTTPADGRAPTAPTSGGAGGGAADIDFDALMSEIMKLNKKDKGKMVAYLSKKLGTAL